MEATAKGAGPAHKFSKAKKGTLDDKGPVNAPASRDVVLGFHALEWLPLWQDTNRTIVDLIQLINKTGITLAPPPVQLLEDTAATYKEQVGMGIDCVNPASYAWLPLPLK